MTITPHTPATLVAASVRHMLSQGRPGYDYGTESCQYRAKLVDGRILSCAIGGLIPDDKYSADIEGEPPQTVLGLVPGCTNKYGFVHDGLNRAAIAIQNAHDCWADGWPTQGLLSRLPTSPEHALQKIDENAPGWREALTTDEVERFIALISTPVGA